MPEGLNTARLYTQLLNTRLQQKDNPLYQVIYSLIVALASLEKDVSGSSSGGGGGSGNVINEIQNVIISDNNESNGNSNNDMVIPGPPGKDGKDGLMGVMMIEGSDSETFYIMGQ